ncbi:hypothetical protein D083_2714 [Dickeya solani RNS 08.23.3.1.A]|nr:hypothetical protein D083_2714 [Dickeya solani RNS 08.23.3.1.A]
MTGFIVSPLFTILFFHNTVYSQYCLFTILFIHNTVDVRHTA